MKLNLSPLSVCTGASSIISLILLQLFIVLCLTGSSAGYGYHDALNTGNSIDVISIKSAALVGIRVFGSEGPAALFINPASLHNINRLEGSVSISSVAWTEEIIDSTSVIQRSDKGLGSLSGAIAFRAGSDIVLSGGLAKVSDHQYTGTHYLPDDPSHPGIDIIEILNSSGGLWEALGGLSWSLKDNFTVGLSTGMRFGEVEYCYTYDRQYIPGIDSVSNWSWETSDLCCHAGILLGDDEFGIGASFTSGSDHYLSRISIAGRARAEHINNIRMGFEGEVISIFEDNYFNGKLSLETPVRNDVNLLAGVGFYEGENMNRVGTAFSIGGNYTYNKIIFECALFHSGRSRKSTSFPNEYSDYVDDSWTQFCFGMTYIL
ncbi:MAG: hypothetical protein K8R76_01860 [Candidatus Aegiribacteria sp.]|nr:hypothetical protein [Candidatus Aegiribacteria sp.]